MPADSAGLSSERPVKGESEVEAWLQSVREDWAPLQRVRTTTHENIEETLDGFIDYLHPLWYNKHGPEDTKVEAPPTLLRDALFEKQRKPKTIRKDIGDLHEKIPLARLLLLACTGTWSRLSCACMYDAARVLYKLDIDTSIEPEDVVSVKMTTE